MTDEAQEHREGAEGSEADREIKAGKIRGPLQGVPWGAKDLFATRGVPTAWATVLRVALAFERATKWQTMHPKIE